MMNKSHAAVGTRMNARMNTRTNTRARSRAQQRGIAVILALIAVSVATLLGLSLATSRDATVATSSNLSKVATARAAAASGIDLASAMLLKADALASLNDATLFNGVSINGANVRAEVRDIETGRPATNESSAIEIIVHAEADGLVQIARTNAGRADARRPRLLRVCATGNLDHRPTRRRACQRVEQVPAGRSRRACALRSVERFLNWAQHRPRRHSAWLRRTAPGFVHPR